MAGATGKKRCFAGVLCTCLFVCSAFRPYLNPQDTTISGETRTHKLITRTGILKSLIPFLQKSPNLVTNPTELEYLEVNPDTLESTWNKVIKLVKSQRFRQAVEEIENSNSAVESQFESSSKVHFHSEQIPAGNERLLSIRRTLHQVLLTTAEPNLEFARRLTGQYLHTLQDFYSNSNWVEMENDKPWDLLGDLSGSIPRSLLADTTEKTCKDCGNFKSDNPVDNCANNLDNNKLTSGYKSGLDIEKPASGFSKCSYGGIYDTSRERSATGGINKETLQVNLSPHYRQHKMAADVAIEATQSFFDSLLNTVGTAPFASLFNLEAQYTISFAIDVSGSMSGEITSVKQTTIDIITQTESGGSGSFVYVLVPFSDPEIGPVTVTSDVSKAIEAVNNLTANGGGDCPELGMQGLQLALTYSLPQSKIFYFSDADIKDDHLQPTVDALIAAKKSKLTFLLSGSCGSRRKRDVVSAKITRKRRSLSGRDLYKHLARVSGGQILDVQKTDMSEVQKYIKASVGVNSTAGLKYPEVIILTLTEEKSSSYDQTLLKEFGFPVDEFLFDVLIVLSAESEAALEISSPSGPVPTLEVVVNTSSVYMVKIDQPEPGQWFVRVSCKGTYSMQISGHSSLDFSYQLMKQVPSVNLDMQYAPLTGRPMKGQNLLAVIEFSSTENTNATFNLTLVSDSGQSMDELLLSQGKGLYKSTFSASFKAKYDQFKLVVTGEDSKGNIVQRIAPTLVEVGNVELVASTETGLTTNIKPGEVLNVPFNVSNFGASDSFTLSTVDDLGFVDSVNSTNVYLQTNQTVQFMVKLSATSDALLGQTSTITVSVLHSSGSIINFKIFYVTVSTQEKDTAPPQCTVVQQAGSCDFLYYSQHCSNITWSVHAQVVDNGVGVGSISTNRNKAGNLTVAPFTPGERNTSITVRYQATCCQRTAKITALDLAGNTGTCTIKLVPDPSIEILLGTKNHRLKLEPGQRKQLKFTVRNTGVKDKFILKLFTGSLVVKISPQILQLAGNETRQCAVDIQVPEDQTYGNQTVRVVGLSDLMKETIFDLMNVEVEVGLNLPTFPPSASPSPTNSTSPSASPSPTKSTSPPASLSPTMSNSLSPNKSAIIVSMIILSVVVLMIVFVLVFIVHRRHRTYNMNIADKNEEIKLDAENENDKVENDFITTVSG